MFLTLQIQEKHAMEEITQVIITLVMTTEAVTMSVVAIQAITIMATVMQAITMMATGMQAIITPAIGTSPVAQAAALIQNNKLCSFSINHLTGHTSNGYNQMQGKS